MSPKKIYTAETLTRLADRMDNAEASHDLVDLNPLRKRMELELENFYLPHPEPFYRGRGQAIISLVRTMLKLLTSLNEGLRPLELS